MSKQLNFIYFTSISGPHISVFIPVQTVQLQPFCVILLLLYWDAWWNNHSVKYNNGYEGHTLAEFTGYVVATYSFTLADYIGYIMDMEAIVGP